VFIGIALSTAGFVLPHAMALGGPATWNALPTLVVLGAALGVVYERTKSPLAVIVMHAGFNAVNVIAAMATTPPAA
jgi:membrane protease YdiL (CAAX protease family)